jgi:hypothetical protein
MTTKLSVSKKRAITFILTVVLLSVLAVPAISLGDVPTGLMEGASVDGAYTLEFKVGDQIIKSVILGIPAAPEASEYEVYAETPAPVPEIEEGASSGEGEAITIPEGESGGEGEPVVAPEGESSGEGESVSAPENAPEGIPVPAPAPQPTPVSEPRQIRIPSEAIPTPAEILSAAPEGSEFLGWTTGTDLTIYTADSSLIGVEGYADIGRFVMYGNTTFDAKFADEEAEVLVTPMSVPGVGTLTASITDDSGNPVPFTDAPGETANISYISTGSKTYNVKIVLDQMPATVQKNLEITLPIGMAWVSDGNVGTVSGSLDSTYGTGGILTTPTSPAAYTGNGSYTFQGGTKNYRIKSTSEALTLNISVAADMPVWTDKIANAISVKLSGNSDEENAVLDTLNIANFDTVVFDPGNTALTITTPVAAGTTASVNSNQRMIDLGSTNILNTYRIIDQAVFKVHVDNPQAVISKISGTEGNNWTLDGSGAAVGDYLLTYSGGYNTQLVIPWEISFPGTWTAGDTVNVTYTEAEVFFKHAPEYPNVIGTSSTTVGLMSAPLDVFKIAPDDEAVYVGYNNAGQAASDSPSLTKDLLMSAQISKKTGVNDEINILGDFRIGNSGSQDSVAKEIILHFDSSAYGVVGTYIPLPAGNPATDLQYKSVSNPSWTNVPGTMSLVGDVDNRASIVNGQLGLARDDYLTDIRYNCGVIPKASNLGFKTGTTFFCAYLGKWIGAPTDSGIATIQVRDAVAPFTHDITSSITTTRRNTLVLC